MAHAPPGTGIARPPSHRPRDVAIVGAGPVGLAVAIELARMGLEVVLLDRRPPPSADTSLRPQLLVARRSDLANLAHLGVPVWDRHLVAPIAERHHCDLVNGRTRCVHVDPRDRGPKPESDWSRIVGHRPVALVPIGRLQTALVSLAIDVEVTICYGAHVIGIKRHRPLASLRLSDGGSLRAKLVIIATGAARSVVPASCIAEQPAGLRRTLIGGVFAVSGEAGRWTRAEVPHRGDVIRCTALATGPETKAGTALIVDAPPSVEPTASRLTSYFGVAADALGLGGDYLVPPRSFETAITQARKRFVGGDGRAPVVIAGDAAQTGHVFSGLVGFVNLGLGLELCEQLRAAKRAIGEGKLQSNTLLAPMTRYQRRSELGAALMHRASQRHFGAARPGQWAA